MQPSDLKNFKIQSFKFQIWNTNLRFEIQKWGIQIQNLKTFSIFSIVK